MGNKKLPKGQPKSPNEMRPGPKHAGQTSPGPNGMRPGPKHAGQTSPGQTRPGPKHAGQRRPGAQSGDRAKRADRTDRARGARDPRYNLIQALLRNGQLRSFNEIFDYVPITVVAADLHIKASTLHKYLADGASIKLRHILTISEFCELTDRELIRLVITFLQRKDAEKKAKIEKTDALVERIKGARE